MISWWQGSGGTAHLSLTSSLKSFWNRGWLRKEEHVGGFLGLGPLAWQLER